MLWPKERHDVLLSVNGADKWEAGRLQAGMATTYADHGAARARHNDFIVGLAAKERNTAPLFHPLYETKKGNRNKLLARYVRDLKRTVCHVLCCISCPSTEQHLQVFAAERHTGAMVLAWVISAHADPAQLVRMDANDAAVVRHEDWDGIHVKYTHIPYSLLVDGGIDPEWAGHFDVLDETVKSVFAKAHVESWGRLRKAAKHPGVLAGWRQPLAADEDDGEFFLVHFECVLMLRRRCLH